MEFSLCFYLIQIVEFVILEPLFGFAKVCFFLTYKIIFCISLDLGKYHEEITSLFLNFKTVMKLMYFESLI